MSRSQQNEVYKQAKSNSQQDQGNAQTAFNDAETGMSGFNAKLGDYYAKDPYGKGGEFEQDQSTINAGRANVNANALQNELNMTGKRSGENTASFAPNLVTAQRQGVLDEADAQAKSSAERIGDETKYQQFGLDASKFPVTANEQLYQGSIGGSNTALGTAEQAGKEPSIWEKLFDNAQQGAKTAATAAAGA